MDVEAVALTVRAFFHHLLSSRYLAHLEEELLRTRSDYETRLLERERTLADLREQLSLAAAKIDRYEMVLIPLTSPVGTMMVSRRAPTFQSNTDISAASTSAPLSSWDEVQQRWEIEQAAEAAKEAAAKATQATQAT